MLKLLQNAFRLARRLKYRVHRHLNEGPVKGIYLTPIFLSSIGSMPFAQENLTYKEPSKLQSHFIFNHGQETAGSTEVLGFPAFERNDSNNNLRNGRAVLRSNLVVNVTREEIQANGSVRKIVLSHQENGSAIVYSSEA